MPRCLPPGALSTVLLWDQFSDNWKNGFWPGAGALWQSAIYAGHADRCRRVSQCGKVRARAGRSDNVFAACDRRPPPRIPASPGGLVIRERISACWSARLRFWLDGTSL